MFKDVTEQWPAPEILAEMRRVVEQAQQGDSGVLPRLREMLDRYPLIWQRGGDMAAQAEMAWVTLAAGPNLHLMECVLRRTEAMRAELSGPAPSPVETLLVERIVALWLKVNYLEGVEAQAGGKDGSPRLALYRAKRLSQAEREYFRALAAFTTLRKLIPSATPAVAQAEVTSGRPDDRIAGRSEPRRDDEAPEAAPALPASIQERLAGLFDRADGDDEPVRPARRRVAVAAQN